MSKKKNRWRWHLSKESKEGPRVPTGWGGRPLTTSEYLTQRSAEIGQPTNGQGSLIDKLQEPTPVRVTAHVQAPSDTFYCEDIDVKGDCPIFEKKSHRVVMSREMYLMFKEFCGDFKIEWQAYLTGAIEENRNNQGVTAYVIDGFYFPPQTGQGALCTNVEEAVVFKPDTIGHIHSHVQMKAFFSGTDIAHANWPVELVINADGDIKARARVKLECGRFTRTEIEVFTTGEYAYPDPFAAQRELLKAALTEGDRLTAERKSHSPTPGYHTTPPASLPGGTTSLEPDPATVEEIKQSWAV